MKVREGWKNLKVFKHLASNAIKGVQLLDEKVTFLNYLFNLRLCSFFFVARMTVTNKLLSGNPYLF